MRKVIVLILLIFELSANAQTDCPKSSGLWNGYTQLRFSSNFNDIHFFAMRRMKIWIKSAPDFNKHWDYKIQATFSSNQLEKFILQDVMVSYKSDQFQLHIGQFIPQYSLQCFQPDYNIPLTERSPVINALIPNGTLGVRDIGVEANYSGNDNKIQTWLGVFNGYGIKKYRLDNSGILLTQKTAFNFLNKHLHAGYSVMYRNSDKIQLSKILPDTVIYSGDDFRYNLFAQYKSKRFQIQTEYIWANLGGKVASGYYILAALCLGKNQLVASWNSYVDIIKSTDDSPVIHFGYNYLMNGDKLKIMFDNAIQMDEGNLKNYFGTIQLQIFFS